MNVGCETISWGIRLHDVRRTLDVIREAGFQGVEFAQRVDHLGVSNCAELKRLLDQRGLAFLGLGFGTLKERMEWCGDVKPAYLYVEEWDEEWAPRAVAKGFTLALHPRAFKKVRRLEDALPLFRAHPELKFLPDTAHLKISGEDPAQVIRVLKDCLAGGRYATVAERIAAVHFKMWSSQLGRSCHRYPRGFTELGDPEGDVDLDAVLLELRQIGYDGWLVAELDCVRDNPEASVRKCAEWFFDPHANRGLQRPARPEPEAETRFLRALMRAGSAQLDFFYRKVVEAFAELLPSKYVSIWACSPSQDLLGLLAVHRPIESAANHPSVIPLGESLTGEVITAHKPVERFDLTRPEVRRRFRHQELLADNPDIIQLVTLPIYTHGNQTYVPLVVNFLRTELSLPFDDERLYRLGVAVSRAADTVLDRVCSQAATRVNWLATERRPLGDYLRELCFVVRDLLECEAVTIFRAEEPGTPFSVGESTEPGDPDPGQLAFARRVQERNEPLFVSPRVAGASEATYLGALLVDSRDRAVAVVVCRNRRPLATQARPGLFSDYDGAVLDAMGQAVLPYLVATLAEERRAHQLGELTHELKNPVTSVVQIARRMCTCDNLPAPYREDVARIRDATVALSRILDNADVFRQWPDPLTLHRAPSDLVEDVLNPAIEDAESWLSIFPSGHEYPRGAIRVYGESLPRLRLDAIRLRQAFFNILSNAITAFYQQPSLFRVKIQCDRTAHGGIRVRVQDEGIGIEDGTEETIFQQGVRGWPSKDYVAAQGLGLWVARQILDAHAAAPGTRTIRVSRNRQPTEFEIILPGTLASEPVETTWL